MASPSNVMLDIHKRGAQSSESEAETGNCGVSMECRRLRTECRGLWDCGTDARKNKKTGCNQKKASSGVDQIMLSSPCGAVDLRETP